MLEPEVFNHIPQTGMYGFGRQLFPLLVERGCPVLGVELTDYWTDIGTLGDYLRANCDAINGLVAVPVKGQKTDFGWIAPDADLDDTCKIEGRLILDSHSKVGRSVRITGSVAIGAGATIADNCSLEDCVIFPGEHVAARSVISRSVVAYGKIVSCASVAKVV